MVMNERKFKYCGYVVVITKKPIYHNFEFVIKTLDETEVVATHKYFLENYESAEVAARLVINDLN